MPDIITMIGDIFNSFIGFLGSEVDLGIFGLKIPVWMIIGLFILLLINIIRKFKPKEESYKEIDLKKELKKDLKDFIDSYSEKIPISYNYKLMLDYKTIGLIKRISYTNWVKSDGKIGLKLKKGVAVITKEDLEEFRATKTKAKSNPLYLFEVYTGDNLITKAKFLLGFKPKHFIVDKSLVTRESNIFDIKNASFSSYLGVNIFSKETKGYVEDIAYKITHEEILKQITNFTPRAIYFDTQSAKLGQRGEIVKDVIKAKKSKTEGLEEV